MRNKAEILRIARSVLGIALLGLALANGFAAPASADTVYSYTGNNFTVVSNGYACPPICDVSGSFSLASPLGDNLNLQSISPVDFSFTDGSNVWNPADALSAFKISTNGSGTITGWQLFYISFASPNNPTLLSENNCGLGCTVADYSVLFSQGFSGPLGAVVNNPGAWVVTPEPSSLLLFGTGLLGLVSARRRWKLLSSSVWPHQRKSVATHLQTARKNPFSIDSQRRAT